jgi:hypothetical protein
MASFIDSIVFGHPPLDNITFRIYITSQLDSAFRKGSNIIWVVKVVNFASSKIKLVMRTKQKVSKTVSIILWSAQGILAVTMIWAGFMKIFIPEGLPFAWVKDHGNLVLLTGVIDLLAGILMTAASFFHISRGEAKDIGFNIFMLILAVFVAWGRQRIVPIKNK